jgi:hypothetical protein
MQRLLFYPCLAKLRRHEPVDERPQTSFEALQSGEIFVATALAVVTLAATTIAASREQALADNGAHSAKRPPLVWSNSPGRLSLRAFR